MKIAILHAQLALDAPQDEQDVLAQVAAVSEALESLGHTPITVPLSLDLNTGSANLQQIQPDLVFNLVESLAGSGQFIYFAPTLLQFLKIPYTGASANAMFLTSNKILTKERLFSKGIPTPGWATGQDILQNGVSFEPPYIIKPVWEDASVGLDEKSIVYDKEKLNSVLKEKIDRFGECFVEGFIPGREFNISIITGKNGPQVLPHAEIVFKDFPEGKPHIVDYLAKWDTDSFEYQNTVRSFDFLSEDAPLLNELTQITRQCWDLFDLRGYARVDFRVDEQNRPWVLEVNANPCISPDSGFVAAAERAGMSFEQVIDRIIQN